MLSRAARIGLILFAVYLALYGGFVFLNAFAPEAMEATPLAGVNLAILYGFGLIGAAFVLALLYGWLARQVRPAVPAGSDAATPYGVRASNDVSTAFPGGTAGSTEDQP